MARNQRAAQIKELHRIIVCIAFPLNIATASRYSENPRRIREKPALRRNLVTLRENSLVAGNSNLWNNFHLRAFRPTTKCLRRFVALRPGTQAATRPPGQLGGKPRSIQAHQLADSRSTRTGARFPNSGISDLPERSSPIEDSLRPNAFGRSWPHYCFARGSVT